MLIGTNNQGKLREYRKLLSDLPVRLLSPRDRSLDLNVPETGQTFRENAELKASAFARASGLSTLADDSGLEVDALGGEPGVHSSRYAGPGASDEDRVTLLLSRLHGVPRPLRTARFRCVIALCTPDGHTAVAEATCEGYIALAPAGANGFGYDPVFYIPELDRTLAQVDPAVKNQLSHRANAVREAKPLIAQLALHPS